MDAVFAFFAIEMRPIIAKGNSYDKLTKIVFFSSL